MKLKYVFLGLLLAFGRYPVSYLLSKKRKVQKPKKWQAKNYHWIKCPSGNIIYVELDGLKDARPLVLVHGLNSNRYQWTYQRSFFRDKFSLVFIDLPGHGKSASPKILALADIASDLSFILQYFNLNNSILYGHSMGGMAVLELMSRNEVKPIVSGIIVQHCTYTNPLKTCSLSTLFWGLQRVAVNPLIIFIKEHNWVIWALNWVYYYIGVSCIFTRFNFFTGTQTPGQLRFMSKISASAKPQIVVEGFRQLLKFDIQSRLKNIKVDTLIIGGKKDRLTKASASQFIHNQIKNSELKLVKEGHLSMIENDREVNFIINQFILSKSLA